MTTSAGETLLDTNVLISLLSIGHAHHDAAWAWFDHVDGHATCTIVELGFLRYAVRGGLDAGDAVTALAHHRARPGHVFWPDESGPDAESMRGVIGHRQVTDFHLASLARRRAARLATFDRGLAAAHPDVVELVALES